MRGLYLRPVPVPTHIRFGRAARSGKKRQSQPHFCLICSRCSIHYCRPLLPVTLELLLSSLSPKMVKNKKNKNKGALDGGREDAQSAAQSQSPSPSQSQSQSHLHPQSQSQTQSPSQSQFQSRSQSPASTSASLSAESSSVGPISASNPTLRPKGTSTTAQPPPSSPALIICRNKSVHSSRGRCALGSCPLHGRLRSMKMTVPLSSLLLETSVSNTQSLTRDSSLILAQTLAVHLVLPRPMAPATS